MKRYLVSLTLGDGYRREPVDAFDDLSDALRYARDECDSNETEQWVITDRQTGNDVAKSSRPKPKRKRRRK